MSLSGCFLAYCCDISQAVVLFLPPCPLRAVQQHTPPASHYTGNGGLYPVEDLETETDKYTGNPRISSSIFCQPYTWYNILMA
jgi:hypothetical protein